MRRKKTLNTFCKLREETLVKREMGTCIVIGFWNGIMNVR